MPTLPDGDSTQFVGIALVESDRVSKVSHWADVVCDVQIAADAESMPQALRRLHSGAASVFAAQATRMYHVGIALAGDSFQLAYYDRSGCVLCGVFNVHTQPGPFLRAVMGLSLLDDSYVGKDTSIILRDGRRYVAVGGVEYEIVELLSFISDILSKGTICWRCRRPDTSEQFVIKNRWAALSPSYRPSEGDYLRKAAGIDGVGPQLRRVFEDQPKMELRRFVLQPCGRPLQDFESKDELLGGFADSIVAHERLYEARGILHCDISDNNVMLRDRGAPPGHRGLLVDLDAAAFVQYDSKSETNLAPISHDVGTLPFMACELLLPHSAAPHAPWHDLESFLYVLMSICATCSGPSNTPRPDFDIEESPMGPWYTGDICRKEQVMCEYDDKEFRAFLDELFDPYFDDLKELVVDLRSILTRMPGLQPCHGLILDIFDRHMKEREDARADSAAGSQRDESPPAGSPTGSKRKLSSRDEQPPPASPRDREGDDASETSSLSSSTSSSRSSHDSSHASDDTALTQVSSKEGLERARADGSEEGVEEHKAEVAARQVTPPLKRRRV
uniref:Protein kinase domain-containing protein n=1 Tax=Schizophyllum commune (strain H4-8 / FGSC 9210) TaxID=578458 RepID=D8Q2U2_SCHCM